MFSRWTLWSLVLFIPSVAFGEVPNCSKDTLQNGASDIVVGKVKRIFHSTEKSSNFEHTYSVAEVSVTDVEKGEAIAKGDSVFVRFWTQKWVGKGQRPPGSNGHRGLPKQGDETRVYLVRTKDRGFDVILPNGFAEPKKDDPRKTKK